MKKIVFVPDSFKGSMGADEVCGIMEKKAREHFPNIETVSIPVADGGEGSVDCFLQAVGGEKIYCKVQGVFGEEMEGFYGYLPGSETVVIEMACCAGLPLAEGRLNPLLTTTYGVGQLLLKAKEKNPKQIILGLGGSATNDGGCGAAAAVGVKFYNGDGKAFVPTGGTLKDIAKIDTTEFDRELAKIPITAMCDIDNPMFGENGAAYIFGPQKGADAKTVKELDDGLRHLNEICKRDLKTDLSALPGGGAAGAMGAGMVAFFGAKLQMGIEVVLDTVNFTKVLQNTDLVFTGEGKLDRQSLQGKVVVGVAKRAKEQGVPVIAVVGSIGEEIQAVYNRGITAVFSINTTPTEFSKSRHFAKENLEITMENIFRFVKKLRG